MDILWNFHRFHQKISADVIAIPLWLHGSKVEE